MGWRKFYCEKEKRDIEEWECNKWDCEHWVGNGGNCMPTKCVVSEGEGNPICPLLSAVMGVWVGCNSKCAWFVKEDCRCAVLVIATYYG